jgi:hypothetical protein
MWRTKEKASLPFLANGLNILGSCFVENFGRVSEKLEKI